MLVQLDGLAVGFEGAGEEEGAVLVAASAFDVPASAIVLQELERDIVFANCRTTSEASREGKEMF